MTLRTLVLDLDKLDAAGLAAVKAAAIVGRTADAEMVTALLDDEAQRPEQQSAAAQLLATAKRLLNNPQLHYPQEEILVNYECRRTGQPASKFKEIGLVGLRNLPDAADAPPPPEPAEPLDTVGTDA